MLHLAMLLVAGIDGVLGYWLITSDDSLLHLLGFVIHVGLAFLFSRILKKIRAPGFDENSNFVQVAFVLSAVLPVYGVLGFLCVYVAMRRMKTPDRRIFEVDEYFLPSQHKTWMQEVDQYEMDLVHHETEIDSFRDLLRSNDRQLEENVINKLAKNLSKNSVNLLKEVVQTSLSDTRILAASALTEMEDKVVTRIEELKEDVQAMPDDDAKVLELARIYDLYCYLGVLDPVVEKHYQKLTLEQYQNFVMLNPDHAAAALEYGRILLNSGQIRDAIKSLRMAMALSPSDINPRIWLAEAYYRCADYENVQKICHDLSQAANLPENIRDVVHCWSEPKSEAELEEL